MTLARSRSAGEAHPPSVSPEEAERAEQEHARQRGAAIQHERQLDAASKDHALALLQICAELHWGNGIAVDYAVYCVERAAAAHGFTRPTYPEDQPKRKQLNHAVTRKIWDRDGWTCQLRLPGCLGHADLTVDHIVPVVKGGTDDEGNLQTACRPCNTRKGARF
jgi:hypothetical protein